MTDLTERLDAIQATLDAATPGPWFREYSDIITAHPDPRDTEEGYDDPRNARVVRHAPHLNHRGPQAISDAEFIAAAPADVVFLLDLARKQGAVIDAVKALHRPINVYDECECPDGTHPDEYEWIDCEDYNGCENSFSHYACEVCCTANDYITEWCSDAHDHSKDTGNICPTIAALDPTP